MKMASNLTKMFETSTENINPLLFETIFSYHCNQHSEYQGPMIVEFKNLFITLKEGYKNGKVVPKPNPFYMFHCYVKTFAVEKTFPEEKMMLMNIRKVVVCVVIDCYVHGLFRSSLWDAFNVQVTEIGKNNGQIMNHFEEYISDIINISKLTSNDKRQFNETLFVIISPALKSLRHMIAHTQMNEDRIKNIFGFLKGLCICDASAKMFLAFDNPKEHTPEDVQKTILGSLLSLSLLPNFNDRYLDDVDCPQKACAKLSFLLSQIHKFIAFLIGVSDDVRDEVFRLFQLFLKVHEGRISEYERMHTWNYWFKTDGFMLNLLFVLIEITNIYHSHLITNIEPLQFEALNRTTSSSSQPPETIRERIFAVENLLIDRSSDPTTAIYMAHKCVQLALNESYLHLQFIYMEIQDLEETAISKIIANYKNVLYSETMIQNIGLFFNKTAKWLLELTNSSPNSFAYVPKFFLQNIIENTIELFNFLAKAIEYEPFILLSLKFLDSSEIEIFPDIHLRGKLGLMLCELLEASLSKDLKMMEKFADHPKRGEIITCVIALYTDLPGINDTGRSLFVSWTTVLRSTLLKLIRNLFHYPAYDHDFREMIEKADFKSGIPLPLKFVNCYTEKFLEIIENIQIIEFLFDDMEKAERIAFMTYFLTMHILTKNRGSLLLHEAVLARVCSILNKCLTIFMNIIFTSSSDHTIIAKLTSHLTLLCVINLDLSNTADKERFYTTLIECPHFSRELYVQSNNFISNLNFQRDFSEFIKSIDTYQSSSAFNNKHSADIPTEFVDPLTQELMSDPVILPKPEIRVDRSTIQHHLLMSSTHPYTRKPLSMGMCLPDSELKEKIQKWKNVEMMIIFS